MQTFELERTLVRSPHELWDRLSAHGGIERWLGGAQVGEIRPPNRMEWTFRGARGVIELEPAHWGTRVCARVEPAAAPAWERMTTRHEIEHALQRLFADLGSRSLQGKESAHRR
jgi:uncharacterized protein YndB with AHSA1/START domain